MFIGDIYIGDHKKSKSNTGNSVRGHKSEVYPANIIWFDYQMLVNKHACKQKYPHPVPS
jgi:hypothetical protein